MSKEEPVDWGPIWDEAAAAELIGKLVFIGLTQFDASGTEVKKWQLHGRIIEANKGKGIIVALEGVNAGRTYTLPPSTSAFRKARDGAYSLRATKEVIHDPDLLATWRIDNPPL
jgi:hypothetical protein